MTLPLVLGLDSSTQSLSAVVYDRQTNRVTGTFGVSYASDPRLRWLGIQAETLLLPPRHPGEADQAPLLYLASLEALFTDLKKAGVDLRQVGLVNLSAQQHGHVYLSSGYYDALEILRQGTGTDMDLAQVFRNAFSYGRAPIWKTSDTVVEAEVLRRAAGGSGPMVARSGSDSPLRFTGAASRKVFTGEPGVWEKTLRLHLLSSFLPSVLVADPDVPVDWGNGSGTSLMNYRDRAWDSLLTEACAAGLPGGGRSLERKLPPMASPLTLAGTVSPWFVEKFGFSPGARVMVGSGDNPQTKVLSGYDLLSLGTSFVMMVGSGAGLVDGRGWGNAMYDGVGNPFLFGCRTNGALVWDQIRTSSGQAACDFAAAEAALETCKPGSVLALWQPDQESFPPAPAVPRTTREPDAGFQEFYAGCIDSSLGLLYQGSRPWLEGRTAPLAVTGGPTSSPGILRRVAALWNRPVVTLGTTGAALGAVRAALAFDGAADLVLPPSVLLEPRPEDVEALHRPGGYLERLDQFFTEVIIQAGGSK